VKICEKGIWHRNIPFGLSAVVWFGRRPNIPVGLSVIKRKNINWTIKK
jgi:hypothetical protein